MNHLIIFIDFFTRIDGGARVVYQGWKTRLVQCLAHIEAYIDFGDDENIEDGVLADANRQVEYMNSLEILF